MKDATLQVIKALPAANATNTTNSIDTGPRADSQVIQPDSPEIEVSVPALPNHVNTSLIITLDLYDSADNSSFTEVGPRIQCRIPGVATTGSAAQTFRFRLPATTRRYVRWLQSVPATDGDNTASSVTYAVIAH